MSAVPSPSHTVLRAVALTAALSASLLAVQPVGAAGAATVTNPAASALAPVSPRARTGLGARSAPSGIAVTPGRGALSGTGSAAGGTAAVGAATGAAAANGTAAGGRAAGAGIPTTTYAPPAGSGLGTAARPTQRTGTITSVSVARKPSGGSSSTSGAAIALAVLAALAALACAAWAIARRQAFEPLWAASLRHSMAEAGFRASATWAEFTDWARLGR
jgi:hypothetical protein